jgi:CheY-like chemotaxis protein/anti-sigma regulatory factor (Ser/Thr protein kinase)
MKRILVVDDDEATRHLLKSVLAEAGYSAFVAPDGLAALGALRRRKIDLVLLDVWMPRMNGLELMERLRARGTRPRIVVMTSDDTPGTLLKVVREQAITCVHKPVAPPALLEIVREALEGPEVPPIEVISARPDWVELLVPCTREAADRIQPVLARLDTDLAPEVRESIAYALRELVMNAVEWGGGLDPGRTVRIAYLRARRMLMYRIADPGPGFDIDNLPHSAIGQPPDDPIAHMRVREEKGIRPGGFGLLMVRSNVDELLYNEKRNEVVFVKYLDEAPPPRRG